MIASPNQYLGQGLYTPAEAAMYARVPTQLLQRWLFGSKNANATVDRQFSEGEDRFVSFLDFVQVLVIRAIRRRGYPLQKIRVAFDAAQEKYGLAYPFAMKHRLFLFGDIDQPKSCELIINAGIDANGDEDYRQLTGKHAGNRMLNEIVEPHMKDLSYDETTQLANQFVAYERHGRRILMDPTRRFGEPYLENCGFTTSTLCLAVRAEGSVRAAAVAFDVEEADVEIACEFADYLDARLSERQRV